MVSLFSASKTSAKQPHFIKSSVVVATGFLNTSFWIKFPTVEIFLGEHEQRAICIKQFAVINAQPPHSFKH